MTFLIRQISITADGREIVRATLVEKDVLTVGRAAENDISLPDLAVEPQHARIERRGDRQHRGHRDRERSASRSTAARRCGATIDARARAPSCASAATASPCARCRWP